MEILFAVYLAKSIPPLRCSAHMALHGPIQIAEIILGNIILDSTRSLFCPGRAIVRMYVN